MNSENRFRNVSRIKYIQRDGTQDSGRLYESGMAALVALRATLDENILDMWVASNSKGLGAFDDLILYTNHKFLGKKIHVVQLKHKQNYTIVKSSFTNKKESFYLNKYRDDYNAIKEDLLNGDDYLVHFFDNLTIDDINFILYTNSDFKKDTTTFPIKECNLTLNRVSHRDILNTGEGGGCVYKFCCQENDDVDFYDKFHFYIRQSRAENLEGLIYSEIKEKFGEVDVAISQNILSFFGSWIAGDLNGHYKLTKEDMKTKLFELMISPYIVEPCFVKEFDETGVWRAILDEVDIVIVEETTTIITSYIYFTLKKIIDRFCGEVLQINLDNWAAPLSSDVTEQIGKNSIVKSAFHDIFGKNAKFSCRSLYVTLWKIDIIPLVVNVTNKQLNLILKKLCLNNHHKLRLIVLGNQFTKMKYLTPYKTFTSLSDIPTRVAIDITSNVTISLQGRVKISLKELIETNDTILKVVDSTTLITMLTEDTVVGGETGDAPEFYINRYLAKPVLQISVLRAVQGHVFIVTGCRSSMDLLNKNGTLNIITFDDLDTIKPGQDSVVICDTIFPRRDYDAILLANKWRSIHHLHYYASFPKCLEWRQTWGDANTLSEFVMKTPDAIDFKIYDTHAVSYTDRKVNIISAHSGMGKSAFIADIANNSPVTMWILLIHLNNFTADLSKDFDNPLDYFYEKIETNRNKLTDAVFAVFKSTKRIVVLLDGFDEISPIYTDQTTKIIKWFESNEYATWVTSRPVMQTYLESTFNTLCFTLQHFSIEGVDEFFRKYLGESIGSDDKTFDAIKDKIKTMEIFKNNIELLGNPLQMKMAANYIKCNEWTEREVDIVDLYDNFMNQKLESYWEKSNWDPTNSIFIDETEERNREFKKMHEKLSLSLFFDAAALNEVTKMKKVDAFLQNVQKGKKNIGIVVGVTENLQPIFGHRTYAEYLTGKWLANKVKKNKIKRLLSKLYHPHFVFIKEVFDRTLARGTKLHTAILNQNVDYVRKCCNAFDKDLGGRTPLHLAASWGRRHFYATLDDPFSTQYIKEGQHYVELKKNNCDEIVAILLEKGLNPYDLDDLMQWNAFDYASSTSCLSLIELLYSRGHYYDLSGRLMPIESLVYFCSVYNYLHIAKTLDDFPNIQIYENGQNLIHVTSQNGNAALQRFIFEKYAHFKDVINDKDMNENAAVHFAAHRGYNNCIDVIIDNGADIDIRNSSGDSSALIAAHNGKTSTLMHFVAKKVDVNVLNDERRSPLHHAAQEGHIYCVLLLIRVGLDIHAKTVRGWTPLHLAAERGHARVVESLLKKGADVNRRSDEGFTALHQAAQFGHIECIHLLLEFNSDTAAETLTGATALHAAAFKGQLECVKILAKYMPKMKSRSYTPLHAASQSGHIDCMEFLLDQGIDINTRSNTGFTPLLIAVESKQEEAVRFLLKRNCDVNIPSDNGFYALHQSVQGSPAIVNMLIEYGADVTVKCNNGNTPLHSAAQLGNFEMFKFIVEKGFDVNAPNVTNYTPLHKLAEQGHIECMSFFLTQNVDINVRDIDGWTAFYFAVTANNLEICKLLIKMNADINIPTATNSSPLHKACMIDMKLVELLLNNNVNVNAQDDRGNAPLHVACESGLVEIADLLIYKGADVNIRNFNGRIPMHFAAHEGNIDCTKLLLSHQSEVNATSKSGCSPLLLAVLENRFEVSQVLLKNGADANVQASGFGPLHLACEMGNLELAILLVNNNAFVNSKSKTGHSPLDLSLVCRKLDLSVYLLSQGALCGTTRPNSSLYHEMWTLFSYSTKVKKYTDDNNLEGIKAKNGWTDLHVVAETGQSTLVPQFLSVIDEVDFKGHTALHIASQNGYVVCVKALVANGATVNISSNLGLTPLHLAASCNHKQVAFVLLENGANINATDRDGATPLHWAAFVGSVDCAEMLIKYSADLEMRTTDGWTPLHTAAASGHENILSLLIEKGGDRNNEDNQGCTPFDLLP